MQRRRAGMKLVREAGIGGRLYEARRPAEHQSIFHYFDVSAVRPPWRARFCAWPTTMRRINFATSWRRAINEYHLARIIIIDACHIVGR